MRFILTTLTLLAISYGLYGQSKNDSEPFPTYQQIKPASPEIIDYVPRQGKAGYVQQKITFRLFDYPDGTVTYILNGKATTDEKRAKETVSQVDNHITNISIGEPASDGKRVIRIDFSNQK